MKNKLRNLFIHSIEELENELGNDFPLSSVLLLLKIPTKGSISMSQLVKTCKLSPAGVSRTVATLAGFSKANRRKMDKPLLTLEDDPTDRRYKVVAFTPTGLAMMERINMLYTRYFNDEEVEAINEVIHKK